MPTNYPTALDDGTSLPTKVDGDVIYAAEDNTTNDAIKALEAKVGIDSSAVTTSHEYKLAHMASTTGTVSSAVNNLLVWSWDPMANAVAAAAPTAATIYLAKIMVPTPITVTNVVGAVGTAGTTYTNAQYGLYSSAGALLSSSAVQAAGGANGFGAAFATVSLPLAVPQNLTAGPTAFVWVAVHFGTNAATACTMYGTGLSGTGTNVGTAAASTRIGTYTGHATNNLATIGTLTPASIASANQCPFLGLS